MPYDIAGHDPPVRVPAPEDTSGHHQGRAPRGRTGDPLYAARRVLHTGADLLTAKQRRRITALFAVGEHVEVEATWGIYQRMIAAYRQPDRSHGRRLMQQLITVVSEGVPAALSEIITLGRTLTQRALTCWPTSRPARHLQRTDRGHL